MTNKEINSMRTAVASAVADGRIIEALGLLRAVPSLPYDIRNEIDGAESHYRYLLRYFAEGAADPTRSESYEKLRADIRGIADRCYRLLASEATPSLYYNNVRTLRMHPEQTIASVAALYGKAREESLSQFAVEGSERKANELNELGNQLFALVWTAFPLSKTDGNALEQMCTSGSGLIHSDRMRLIAAIGLGLMEFYDARRLELLAAIVDYSDDDREALAAVTWLLLALFRFRNRKHPDSVANRLCAAAEHPLWPERVRTVYTELLRSRDTERVVRHIADDMMPDIMELGKKMWGESHLDQMGDFNAEPDANPEWEKKMHESGMMDRMREFSEMSLEGADVFMGAFAHLKNFPFFNDITAWFTPFDDYQHDVSQALSGDTGGFVDVLCRMPLPCDNDKFSILFSVNAMPASQRERLGQQLDASRSAIEEAMRHEEGASLAVTARSYVQNVYRFYKLYSRRNEFFDPFGKGVFLLNNPLLHDVLAQPHTLQATSELLFKIEAWQDALACYNELASLQEPTPELYQKSGYCHEKMGRYEQAAECYSIADLMGDNSSWTARRLAAMLRATGKSGRAVEVLERLCRKPDADVSDRISLAYALIEARRYSEAAQRLRDIQFSEGSATHNLLRPLAWCNFMCDDMEAARECYRQILADNPDSRDYLNMGHLAWAEGRMADAVRLYMKTKTASGGDRETLRKAIMDDISVLASKGVGISELPLILDAVEVAESLGL
ncbi:MAG: tetratricopeptide repeat protein [Muribaculaceae bacterium]|nr:tetratricopeptide repeat protein [Muribaculaceae bacterium]